MQKSVGKEFFEEIRRNVKISYFVASIIPLALLVYFSIRYIIPAVTKGDLSGLPLHIGIILVLAVVVSVLGFFLSTKTTNRSISTAQDLHSKLNSLVEITKKFRATPYIDLLLEDIVKSAVRLNSVETGSLLLLEEENNLHYKIILGKYNPSIKDRILKKGEGVAGWVAKTGQPALINDVTEDKRYNPEFDIESGLKTRSIMCVPLIHSNEIIGVIELLNKKEGVFTSEDERLLHSLADQAAISIVQSKFRDNQQSDIIQITSILVEAQDRFSQVKKGHARNVANYANLIGKQMGLPEKDLKNLYHASLFHDIGFLKIDISTPFKPSDKEKIINHPRIGYEMIKPLSLWSEAAELILGHHERYDGTGYPLRKRGEEIPLGARILFVAETFDVLTSKTSYKDPLDFNTAIIEIEANAGSQFDPEVVRAFRIAVRETGLIS